MPRPPKYTDSDIAAAIEFLAAAGEDINPMRVRMRLGGGNIGRIKTIIEQQADQLVRAAALIARTPDDLSREFQRLSKEASQQVLLLANKCWTAASSEASSAAQDENFRLKKRLAKLEADLTASTDLLVQVEAQRDQSLRDLELRTKEGDELAQQCGDLKAALRNAESDLRATQKMIESFERNQRQDRGEIRQLQKRIEELVAELATLKANALKTETSSKPSERRKAG
jgi:DNA repair exonuclease SbcCD ATPase subunit